MNEKYRAYLWAHDGKQIPGFVEIGSSPQEIMNYFRVQSRINPTVVVIDQNDMVVAKMENGKLVWPKLENGAELDFTKTGDEQ